MKSLLKKIGIVQLFHLVSFVAEKFFELPFRFRLRHRIVKARIETFAPLPETKKFLDLTPIVLPPHQLKPQRKNVVFTCCGKRSLHRQWSLPEDRNWDLITCYYDDGFLDEPFADFNLHGGVNKTQAFYLLAQQQPQVLSYQSFWLMDDDITLEVSKINELFNAFESNSADLAQPSLSEDSFTAWKFVYHHKTKPMKSWLPHFFIEVMCPLFSRRAMEICLPSFNWSASLFGLDVLWPHLLPRNYRVGILNNIVVGHLIPPSKESGAFYRRLTQNGIDADQEKKHINRHFKLRTPSHE